MQSPVHGQMPMKLALVGLGGGSQQEKGQRDQSEARYHLLALAAVAPQAGWAVCEGQMSCLAGG